MESIFKQFFTLTIIVFTVFSVTAQPAPKEADLIAEHKREVENHRKKKDEWFRDKETTLLTDDLFEGFTGISYFPIDYRYKIKTKLTRFEDVKSVPLPISTGGTYGFVLYGKINFVMEGQPFELEVYEMPLLKGGIKSPYLFVPFRDETTGEETYGGGRFVIVKIPEGDDLIVDFNLAKNPNCVYNPHDACPIVPASNVIPLRVEVGPKMYNPPTTKTPTMETIPPK